MNIKIEKAQLADCIAIHECNKRNLPIYYSPYEIALMVKNLTHLVVVSKIFGNIASYLIGECQNGGNFHILSIGVDYEVRRMGIGRKMIDFILGQIVPKYKTISLFVHSDNSGAVKFYQKYGFKIEKTVQNYYSGHLKDVKTQDAHRMVYHI